MVAPEFQRFLSYNEVITGLCEASTLADPEARPYDGAHISYQELCLCEFRPTQYYAIEALIESLRELRKVVLDEADEDILHMSHGGIELNCERGREVMLPPIIEDDVHEGPILLDGTHRALLAKRLGMSAITAILVSGVSEEFAVSQRLVPNCWHEIRLFDTMDDLKLARQNGFMHRGKGSSENPDEIYRDLSKLTGRGKDVRK